MLFNDSFAAAGTQLPLPDFRTGFPGKYLINTVFADPCR